MSRLTEQDEQGNWGVKGLPWKDLYEGNLITKKIREKLYGCLAKLKDYENTGLSPEQAEELADKDATGVNADWIPVSERLPEDKTVVLATVWHKRWIFDYERDRSERIEHPEHYEVCSIYRDGNEYVKMDDSEFDDVVYIPVEEQEDNIAYPIEVVTAWMPLPEPYKEIQNEID